MDRDQSAARGTALGVPNPRIEDEAAWIITRAEAACRLAPQQRAYVNTLGIARYRMEMYREAVVTLGQSEKIGGAKGLGSLPSDLAFLAMAQ